MSETSMREKRRKLKEQNEAARDQDKIFPWGSNWEDAQLISKNTRQGQEYWRDHMNRRESAIYESKYNPEAVKKRRNEREEKKKHRQNRIVDHLLNK